LNTNNYLDQVLDGILDLWSSPDLVNRSSFSKLTERVITCFKSSGTLAFAGNGGSAAESSHLAAEFTGKCLKVHKPWKALCLNDSASSITAISNDFGFEETLARQSQALLQKGDILIALSTSGNSKNVVRLLSDAKSRGIYSLLWTGKTYDEKSNPAQASEIWKVQSAITSRIQEVHLFWGHLLAELIENNYE
jgi:D-sedoheptulose 7-phosphate isomerase